jgi:hypothetical protein
MTELRPLKLASNQAVSRLLLQSALEDHSAPGAAERALQALNVGVVVAATTVTAKAATSASVGSHFAGGIVFKWLGFGLVAGAATLLSAERVMRVLSEPSTAPALPARRTANPLSSHPNRDPVAPAAPSALESTPPAAKAQLPVESRPPRAADRPPPAPEVNLAPGEPLQELRAIRSALADQAPERALWLLDRFAARYPASSLLEEAAVLRFDALAAASRSEARAEGQNFLHRYPRSAYAERVRSKLSMLP